VDRPNWSVDGALELLADGEAFFRVALCLVLVQRLQALAHSWPVGSYAHGVFLRLHSSGALLVSCATK
jgi:hypothetical protein